MSRTKSIFRAPACRADARLAGWTAKLATASRQKQIRVSFNRFLIGQFASFQGLGAAAMKDPFQFSVKSFAAWRRRATLRLRVRLTEFIAPGSVEPAAGGSRAPESSTPAARLLVPARRRHVLRRRSDCRIR